MHQIEEQTWEKLAKQEQDSLARLTRKYADVLSETLQEMKRQKNEIKSSEDLQPQL